MNREWSEFLATRSTPGSDGADINCALNDLSHYGLIRVEGEDAEQFLQGQMTNDMREVTETHSNLAGWCNAKGRMIASFRCFRQGGSFYLQTPADAIPALLPRLSMYVLRSKVEISDVSDEWVRIGLTGDCAEALLQPFFNELPEQVNGVEQQDGMILIRLPGTTPRFEVIGPGPQVKEIWQTAEGQAQPATRGLWSLYEIRAGVLTLYPQTRESFVPQMANMQLIDGVSFTKGCYTGQEVVARMQYLGKLKRRMYLAHVVTQTPPQPGDELFAEESTSEQGAGKVVDAQASGEGYDLLAVIEIASAEENQVRLGENGPRLEILNLPYSYSEE
ncbi:MAG: folate-binding protein YgfZ [Candidatus Thiodiazotropha endolucinida]|uniref:tRNA-modifying protein YgfZ n=1 Tax=Candidatus Thiodiazotropha endolucinida TaxID=1655433 RepID=A0A7Z0VKA5_9GAMM|nr:folate-binding protein YgfZ [Candidatus Thiodiazotropha endolucinida]ODJ86791.1 tRNA-modifying protein YgfZ [Candidatus Thiodiazotropha endolucinida]